MRKVAKKVCKLSLFSQLSAPIKSGVTNYTGHVYTRKVPGKRESIAKDLFGGVRIMQYAQNITVHETINDTLHSFISCVRYHVYTGYLPGTCTSIMYVITSRQGTTDSCSFSVSGQLAYVCWAWHSPAQWYKYGIVLLLTTWSNVYQVYSCLCRASLPQSLHLG